MTDSSHQPVPKTFLWQWICATAVGYSVSGGVGLTYFERAPSLAIAIMVSTGLWVSVLQWLVLRQMIKDASQWIWLGWLSFGGGSAVLVPLLSVFFLPALVSVLWLLFYPLAMSAGQWLILRRCVKPSWWWILVNSVAMLVGIAGLMVATLLLNEGGQPLSLAAAIGGLGGGAIQGWISGVGLRRLLKQRTSSRAAVAGQEKPPTPQTGIRLITTALFFLCMVGWLMLVLQTIDTVPGDRFSPILLSLLFLLYFYGSILIHELGHLVGALASGFKLNFLTVMRFVLIQEQGGLRLRLMRKMSAGGLTSTVPMSHHHLRQKLMILVAGGPIASFLLFLIGLILLPFTDLVSQNLLFHILFLFAGLNLYLAITNSLPLKIGFYTTDGYILSALARNTMDGQRFLALYEYLAEIAQGVRPRDLADELVARSLAKPEQSMHHGSGLIMAYYNALDNGDIDQAGGFLDEALVLKDYIPEFIRASLFMEAAYFEAHYRHSATTAQDWFNQVEEFVFIPSYTQRRVEAAISLAQGNHQQALKIAQKGLEAIYVNSLGKGMAIAEHDWLNQILTQSTSI